MICGMGLSICTPSSCMVSFIPVCSPFRLLSPSSLTTVPYPVSSTYACRHDILACTEPSNEKPSRDYFSKIKAENTSDKIKIFGKNDYEYAPGPLPWNEPYRGRSLEEIRARNAKRKVPEGLPDHPFRWTDLFAPEELEDDKKLAREASLFNHQTFEEKVTKKNDLKNYDGIWLADVGDGIDFENAGKMLDQLGALHAPEGEVVTEEMLEALLWDIVDEEQGLEDEMAGFAESIDPPDQEMFNKWRHESEKRGGPVLKNGTDMLSPVKNPSLEALKKPATTKADVPLQNTSLKAHDGTWVGVSTFYEIEESGKVRIADRRRSVRDKITMEEPYDHNVRNPDTLKVSRTIRNCEEGLSPGKAVWPDGSYSRFGGAPLVSGDDLRDYITSENLRIIGELCIVGSGTSTSATTTLENPLRYQVILCGEDVKRKKGTGTKISAVIVTCERRMSPEGLKNVVPDFLDELPEASLDSFAGKWQGTGLSLHPMNFVHPAEVTSSASSLEATNASPPNLSELTYHLKQAYSLSDEIRAEAKRAYQQHKPSTRVKAARSFDSKRVSQATHIENQVLGCFKEHNAVKVEKLDGESDIQIRSLRLGEFIGDKISIIGKGNVSVGFPMIFDGKRAETIQIVVPSGNSKRKRLVVSLAIDWTLTGGVLLDEKREAMN